MPIIKESSKYTIITQKKIKQDTSYIKDEAPKTWNYLNDNRQYFDKRKVQFITTSPISAFSALANIHLKNTRLRFPDFIKTLSFHWFTVKKQ